LHPLVSAGSSGAASKNEGPVVAFQTYVKDKVKTKRTVKTMVMTDVQCNVGGAYSSKTGLFTAPVEGLYLFRSDASGYQHKKKIRVGLLAEMFTVLLIEKKKDNHCKSVFI
jgi:hypothetical protein